MARGHTIAKWQKVSNTAQFSYRRIFSLLRLRLLAVHHVVHLVDETDDYLRYFACYEYTKRNNLQNQITLHLTPPCAINLKFLTSFFQNWIVLRMFGIRDCVPLNEGSTFVSSARDFIILRSTHYVKCSNSKYLCL